jgi:hypothetical protein
VLFINPADVYDAPLLAENCHSYDKVAPRVSVALTVKVTVCPSDITGETGVRELITIAILV